MKKQALEPFYRRSHFYKESINFTLIFLITMLTACGGGSGSEEPDDPITPAPPSTSSNRVQRLNNIETWMYQIQELNLDGAVESLAATNYPMLVIEPGHNFKLASDVYDTADIITQLRTSPNGT